MNILFIGDIVGNPGRKAVMKLLPQIKKDKEIDVVIANADNLSSKGRGASVHGIELMMQAGVDAFTNGDHVWKFPDFVEAIDNGSIPGIRPANYPSGAKGKGWLELDLGAKGKILLINLQGRVFMRDLTDDPFRCVDTILEKHPRDNNNAIWVDVHAEATSEKVALAWYLDGRVSAVVGTHTHIPTADATLLDQGTAYVSDIGMTGPFNSVLGVKTETIISIQMQQTPHRFETEEEGPVDFRSVFIQTDNNGNAAHIERLDLRIQPNSQSNKVD
jgi:metallophosphoesterase (TIGR00282 family)